MTPKESSTPPVPDANCLVCMKSIRDGEGVSHFRFGDRWVTICCPVCFELFQGDPQQYLGRKLPPRRENPSFGV